MNDNPYAAPVVTEDDDRESIQARRTGRLVAVCLVAGGITGVVATSTLLKYPGPPSGVRLTILWGLVIGFGMIGIGLTLRQLKRMSRERDETK